MSILASSGHGCLLSTMTYKFVTQAAKKIRHDGLKGVGVHAKARQPPWASSIRHQERMGRLASSKYRRNVWRVRICCEQWKLDPSIDQHQPSRPSNAQHSMRGRCGIRGSAVPGTRPSRTRGNQAFENRYNVREQINFPTEHFYSGRRIFGLVDTSRATATLFSHGFKRKTTEACAVWMSFSVRIQMLPVL